MSGTLSPHEALTLDGLGRQWTGLYRTSHAAGVFIAIRWDDARLTAGTVVELAAAMRSDFYHRVTR